MVSMLRRGLWGGGRSESVRRRVRESEGGGERESEGGRERERESAAKGERERGRQGEREGECGEGRRV
jgi:hypothetical protein